jgi:hypothetical protein
VREKYCWLVAGGWFILREKYCWLVADKPNEHVACLLVSAHIDNFYKISGKLITVK